MKDLLFKYTPGLNHVGSYQVSGTPWITGSDAVAASSQHHIQFPLVTKRIVVTRHDSNAGTLRIHFAATGSGDTIVGRHYIELDSDEDSFEFNVKVREIYLSTDSTAGSRSYRLYAELTNIPHDRCQPMSGSGINLGCATGSADYGQEIDVPSAVGSGQTQWDYKSYI